METINKKTEVVKLFSDVTRILKHSMHKSFEDAGITMPQSLVIGTLIKYGEMKISDLSKKIYLSNSTISGIVDRLEKQQLVIRTRSEEDRRIIYVKVSPTFSEVFNGIFKQAEESFEELLSPGTPEDIEKILEGLSTLRKLLYNKN